MRKKTAKSVRLVNPRMTGLSLASRAPLVSLCRFKITSSVSHFSQRLQGPSNMMVETQHPVSIVPRGSTPEPLEWGSASCVASGNTPRRTGRLRVRTANRR